MCVKKDNKRKLASLLGKAKEVVKTKEKQEISPKSKVNNN